ncbi:hypothetical protein SAMN05421505_108103 [Sinosporangium album]|uniref:DUF2567 domain-containing protein n=1 Tax=Sinosporangium album TaxID=504805 RepID=A0A1G7XA24_9ACTN|nr:hypothetical protein [Sinosporangium album]SDG81095.1 hypothetical protein SAMN05421505_108103 [Sinosporangium album]
MRDLRDFVAAVLVLALLGVAAGFVWSYAAPRTAYLARPEGAVLADPSTQALIAADGWFAVVTGLLGLICGIAGHILGRERPIAMIAGLTAGGVAASYLTLAVGRLVNLGESIDEATHAGSVVSQSLTVTAQGVLLAWPLLAVGVFFAIEGVLAYRESPLRKPYGGREPVFGHLPYGGGDR